ncbi:MAG: ribbon-helix-helix protein, CopG family [Deltaproteobacteria bacterium]|nr:ribbon-helix-helix protein, CopG family [Deltaproteobacteria bacterium]
MAKTNLQIRLPEELEEQIREFAQQSKSSFIREAIQEKLKREKDKKREEQWIKALRKNPEDPQEAKAWMDIEAWGEK